MDTQLTTIRDLDPVSLLARADIGDATRDKYTRVLGEYLATGADIGDAGALAAFADTLSNSRKAHLKAAVRLWADKMTVAVKSQATPDNLPAVQANVLRFEALNAAIDAPKVKGDKTHTWLSAKQVKQLANAIGNGIQGARDRVAIGLLVSAGLRREEAVNLTFDDIKYQPVGEKMRAVLAIQGKGDKGRTVPISDRLAADLDKWGDHVGHTGRVLRGLGRLKEPTDSLSAVGLFKIVARYGAAIGKPELAPHDLRRSYAQIGFENGVPITQISKLLGHASVATTQRYLNLDLDLDVTASDFVPW